MQYSLATRIRAAITHPHLTWRYLRGRQPGEYELEEVARFINVLDPIIIEAGAFDGRDSTIFAKRWPLATIYAFEPLASLHDRFHENTKGLANVHLQKTALVGDNRSTVEMHTFESQGNAHGSSSTLQPTKHLELAPDIKFETTVTVPATTLDTWFDLYRPKRVDMMWLDLQGAELKVLKCAESVLAVTQAIHIEVNRVPLYENSATYKDVRSFLEAHGFKERTKRIPVASGNAIFTRV
jgi:FkbM family methyltransferase